MAHNVIDNHTEKLVDHIRRILAEAGVLGSPAHIPVTLRLVDELERGYLPLVTSRAAPQS